ncbi:MAG: DUF1127 domain-containing protein [Pseudomonadota bacterium]
MAHIDTHSTVAHRPTAIFGLGRKIWDYVQRRQTQRTLLKLTDRELDDIGLNRADVQGMR